MSLPVTPPDPTLNQPHLVVDRERRRAPHPTSRRPAFDLPHEEAHLDITAPVSVEAGTGAALADLDAIDTVPLSTAISRYAEETESESQL